MSEAEDTTYNGWSNYPTWCVNLWLGNDEALYLDTQEAARNAQAAAQLDQAPEDADRYARNRLANDLKDWVTNELAPDLGATFAADLLGYALGEVDWYEIAEAWLSELVQA